LVKLVHKPIEVKESTQVALLIQEGLPKELLPYTIYAGTGYGRYLEALLAIPATLREAQFMGAYLHQSLAGFMEYRLSNQKIFLNNIYMGMGNRGQGIGRSLMQFLFELGKKARCTLIQLDVFEQNEKARAWYTQLGFETQQENNWYEGIVHSEEQVRGIKSSFCQHDRFFLLKNGAQAQAIHKEYGFSMVEIETSKAVYQIGRLGQLFYRLYSIEQAHDEELLMALQILDPHRKLILISADALGPHPNIRFTPIMKSYRMACTLN